MTKATRATLGRGGAVAVACLIPAAAYAHSLSATPYFLPVPFWIYVYGCAATLIVTFAMLGFFWNAPVPAAGGIDRETSAGGVVHEVPAEGAMGTIARWGLRLLRVGTVASLLVAIVAGLAGTSDPTRNINMSLFWVVFLLGFAYLTFFIGDLYALINPWNVAIEWVERAGIEMSAPRLAYPPSLGYWPAFVGYVALIWFELFALPQPSVLSVVLIAYSAMTFIGVYLFGKTAWFNRCDVFSVFFRLVATLAPVEYAQGPDAGSWRVRLRPPFRAAQQGQGERDMSLVLFVLFMLSSTTYDAIHQTVLWIGMYWRPMLSLSQPLWGSDLARAQSMLEGGYVVYQRAGLLLSPFLYWLFYMLVLWVAKIATRVPATTRTLAVEFAYSLIPIALAYHVTHYYPMLIVEGAEFLRRISDPLGAGWNLLGLAPAPMDPAELQMGIVWHTQVALILVGHLISVYLAHVIALKTFRTRQQVVVSQVPLLLLMVILTAVGLWVLALPLAM